MSELLKFVKLIEEHKIAQTEADNVAEDSPYPSKQLKYLWDIQSQLTVAFRGAICESIKHA